MTLTLAVGEAVVVDVAVPVRDGDGDADTDELPVGVTLGSGLRVTDTVGGGVMDADAVSDAVAEEVDVGVTVRGGVTDALDVIDADDVGVMLAVGDGSRGGKDTPRNCVPGHAAASPVASPVTVSYLTSHDAEENRRV